MNAEKQNSIIQSYIAAYNDFDIDRMVALFHPDVVFKNVAGENFWEETRLVKMEASLADP